MTDEAFAQEILKMTETLYRICYAQLRQQADREDAVQEALKKAWEKRRNLREEGALKPWIIRILLNECHNIQRKNKKEAPVEKMKEGVYPPESDHLLHDLILALPEKFRLPTVLVFMEGMTAMDAARILHLPSGTIHSRIHKARQILKKQWEEANRE